MRKSSFKHACKGQVMVEYAIMICFCVVLFFWFTGTIIVTMDEFTQQIFFVLSLGFP